MKTSFVPAVLFSGLLAAHAPHGGSAPDRPAGCLPASSYACVEFAGLAKCRTAAESMELLAIVDGIVAKVAPDGGPIGAVRRELPKVDAVLARFGLDRATVRALLQGSMSLGISRPTFFGDTALPSMTLVIDIAERRDAAERFVRSLHGALMGAMPGMQKRGDRCAGVEFTVVRPLEHNGAVATALTGRYLLLSNCPGYLEDCLRTMAGERPSLAAADGLRSGRQRLGDSGLISGFVNTAPFIDWIGNFLPYEMDDVFAALGVEGIDGLFVGVGASSQGSSELVHVGLRMSQDGLLPNMIGTPTTARAAKYCPPDTLVFASAAVDFEAVADAARAFVTALPNGARAELRRHFDEDFERELARELGPKGVAVLRGIARCGPEFTFALTSPAGQNLVPTALAFVDVPPGHDVAGELADFLAQVGVELEEARFEGGTIRYGSVELHGLRMTPAFTQHDGMLMIATELRALKGALATDRHERRQALADADSFRRLLRGHERASALCTIRLQDNVGRIWQSFLPLIENLVDSQCGSGLTSDDLPDAERLRAALGDMLFTVEGGRDGVALRSRCPFGLGVLLAACGKFGDDVLELGTKVKPKVH